MTNSTIRALKPNVTQAEAVRLFSPGGIADALRRMRLGPLDRIAEAYVPYWVYRVRYQMGRSTHTRRFAIDAVQGSLDLFEFPLVPENEHLVTIQTRNFLPSQMESTQAEKLLKEKVLRVIFLQGFFKLRDVNFEAVREPLELHLPYWLGFYQGQGQVRCRVLDAIRCRIEGAKASALFEHWLAA